MNAPMKSVDYWVFFCPIRRGNYESDAAVYYIDL